MSGERSRSLSGDRAKRSSLSEANFEELVFLKGNRDLLEKMVEVWTVAVGGPLHHALGSGVLYLTAHGRVVITCAHVVRQLQQQEVHVRLSWSSDQQWAPARVVYCAPPDHRVWDLAVLALNNQDEGRRRHYGDTAAHEDFTATKLNSFEGFPACNMDTNHVEKGSAVVMHGYQASSGTGHPTPRAPLTARRASVIDIFYDEDISRGLVKICPFRKMDVSKKANNDTFATFNENNHEDLAEDFDVVALLLAGSASPGMSGGPILRMTSNGPCLVGFIVTSVREAGCDGVAGVLAVPAWPVVAALHLYHQSGDETVFKRTLRRPSPELGRLWPQALLCKL